MSLKNLPIDTVRLGPALCVMVEAKTDPETGEIKTNRDGIQMWTVVVAVRPEGRKTALVEVSVPGEPVGITVGLTVRVVALEAFSWEIDGRSGLAFRAERVVPEPAPARTPMGEPIIKSAKQ